MRSPSLYDTWMRRLQLFLAAPTPPKPASLRRPAR